MVAKKARCFCEQEDVIEFEPVGGTILVNVAKNVSMLVEKHGQKPKTKFVL